MVSSKLVAASSAPIVLAILTGGESYGYAILQRIAAVSDGALDWTEGMLYPVLHRMEREGLIKAFWRPSESGRRRKYYSIAAKGKRALAEQREEWRVVQDTLGELLGGSSV
ncbi:MAG: PadR family transcriptional regulator PadR [Planctomycetota bacterium]|jgi:PadR family transcriptional regulator PadR